MLMLPASFLPAAVRNVFGDKAQAAPSAASKKAGKQKSRPPATEQARASMPQASAPAPAAVPALGGFNGLNRRPAFASNGSLYDPALKFRSLETHVDILPSGGHFPVASVQPGYYGAHTATSLVMPPRNSLLPGDSGLSSAAGAPDVSKAAPMVRWGFGSMVPGSERIKFHMEASAFYQGLPKTTSNPAVAACDPLAALVCQSSPADLMLQGHQGRDLSRYYPAFSMGFSYKF